MGCLIVADRRLRLPRHHLMQLTNRVLRSLHRSAVSVSLVFVGEAKMRTLNRKHRGHDRSTDVLSFPAVEGTSRRLPGVEDELGDIVISMPQAKRSAAETGTTIRAALDRLVVHGLLHLAGYDHHRPSDRRRMERFERRLLGDSLIGRAGDRR